jgi:hypothetical protein
MLKIMEINGFDDALWALRAVDSRYDNAIRLYNCVCAQYILHRFEYDHPGKQRPYHRFIEIAKRYARGQATEDELCGISKEAWDYYSELWKGAGDVFIAHRDTALAAARTAAEDPRKEAWCVVTETKPDFYGFAEKEFIHLCKLEGEYGHLVKE